MASGMNGQQFHFAGYLPIENSERAKAIKELEAESARKHCTEIFIETPYRNNQLLESLLRCCADATRICVAAEITGANEWIKTLTVAEWKKLAINLHKRPVIFLLYAGQ
jgi:16S rRNA (cytidine1402-2'-O)-methyltransferase